MIALTVLWVVGIFNYFMIMFQVKYFPGNFTVNTAAMYGSEILASLLTTILLTYLKPKTVFKTFSFIMVLAGLSILLFIEGKNPGIEFPILVALG